MADVAAVAQVVTFRNRVERTDTGDCTGSLIPGWIADSTAVLDNFAGLNEFLLQEEPETLDLVDTNLLGVAGYAADEVVEVFFAAIILSTDQ